MRGIDGGVGSTPGAPARTLIQNLTELQQRAVDVLSVDRTSVDRVQVAYGQLRSEMVRRELHHIPIDRLKEATDGRLRLGMLEKAGYRTVLAVYDASPSRLELVPGVGTQTAMQAHAAARQVAAAVEHSLRVRVDRKPGDPELRAGMSVVVDIDTGHVRRLHDLIP